MKLGRHPLRWDARLIARKRTNKMCRFCAKKAATCVSGAPVYRKISKLRVVNSGRGIESFPLRHAVWNAEKPGSSPRKIARNGRNFANLAQTPDWRKCPAFPLRQALRPVP